MSMPWRPWACAQDGTESKGMTAAEFKVLMGKLLAEVRSRAVPFSQFFPLGYVIVSSDNHSCHREWQNEQDPQRLNTIPPNSPDIHKVVEHPLNGFNKRWYARFSADRRCNTMRSAMQLASETLHAHTAASIEADMRTLPDTFAAIIDRKGDWAPAGLC